MRALDMNTKEWVEVVPPLPRVDAEKKFQDWKDANPELARELKDDDVRVDIIRSNEHHTVVRYRVRR